MNDRSDLNDMLLCSIAMSSLLIELDINKLLASDYYKDLNWEPFIKEENAEILKKVINKATLSNPVMLQSLLYMLLVIPKELIDEYERFAKDDINEIIENIILQGSLQTNYATDSPNVDYFRHIRNAVAHSNIEYLMDDKHSVMFKDSGGPNSFSVRIASENVGKIIQYLIGKLMLFWNEKNK